MKSEECVCALLPTAYSMCVVERALGDAKVIDMRLITTPVDREKPITELYSLYHFISL